MSDEREKLGSSFDEGADAAGQAGGKLLQKGIKSARNNKSQKPDKNNSKKDGSQHNATKDTGNNVKGMGSQAGNGTTHGGAASAGATGSLTGKAAGTASGTTVGASAAGSTAGAAAGSTAGTAAGATATTAATTAAAAAGTASGAAAGTTAGAAIGTAVGPVGTAVGAGVGTLIGSFGKYIAISLFVFCLVISGAVAEIMPSLLTKPVAANQTVMDHITSFVNSIIEFFTGDSDEDRNVADFHEAVILSMDIIDRYLEMAYQRAEGEIADIAAQNNYDYEMTYESFMKQGNPFTVTDYAFIIAAYTCKVDYQSCTVKEFKNDLALSLDMTYDMTHTEANEVVLVPKPIYRYKAKKFRVITDIDYDELNNPIYSTTSKTYYEQTDEILGYATDPDNGKEVTEYIPIEITVLSGGMEVGLEVYEKGGKETLYAEYENITYGQITIEAFKNENVYQMFSLDPDAEYQAGYETTNRQMIQMKIEMVQAVAGDLITSKTLQYGDGLTLEQIDEYLDSLPSDLSGNRRQVIQTALSLVGKVSYNWGGKPSGPGWNDQWWDYNNTDYRGRPSGLDCSGFVKWTFWTAGFEGYYQLMNGTSGISNNFNTIAKKELQIGDIGLKFIGGSSSSSEANHTGIYLGKTSDGTELWIHCQGSPSDTVVISTTNFKYFKSLGDIMDGDELLTELQTYTPTISSQTDEIYLTAQIMLQEAGYQNTDGMIAVVEVIKNRVLSDKFDNTVVEVITAPGQFTSYRSNDYKKHSPTVSHLTMVKEVFNGTKSVLNNSSCLYFQSGTYYENGKCDPWVYKLKLIAKYNNYFFVEDLDGED